MMMTLRRCVVLFLGVQRCAVAFVVPVSPVVVRCEERRVMSPEFFDDGWEEVPIVRHQQPLPPSDDLLFVAVPVLIVASLFVIANVITVPVEDLTPPPLDRERPADYYSSVYGGGEARRVERTVDFEVEAIGSALELFKATIYQWRVFSLETRYPTGFYSGQGDSAALEFLRALYGFFTSGLANQVVYESKNQIETAMGPDFSNRTLPLAPFFDRKTPPRLVVRRCQTFVPDFGLSIAAKDKDTTLGIISLRVRYLPPRHNSSHYRSVGYITGLAVSRTARRRGVATALVDFCARKSKAWGADALCLHVNNLNRPALSFYATQGFELIDDWLGYNPRRVLLQQSFTTTSSSDDEDDSSLFLQDEREPH